MSESILSKVLESIEAQSLPEGEYLEICNLVKQCHSNLKNREAWIPNLKVPIGRTGFDFHNESRLCMSINIIKAKLWKKNNNVENSYGSGYIKCPDDKYDFEINYYKNLHSKDEIVKSVIVEKTSSEVMDFIKSIMSIHKISKYEIFYQDIILESFELYSWISETKARMKKISKMNHSESDNEDEECDCGEYGLGDDNFIHFMTNDMKKLISIV